MTTSAPDVDVVVHVSGSGNIYMTEIAELVSDASRQLGRDGSVRVDELPEDDGRLHLIVAPHEFFLLHPADESTLRRSADLAVCVNVEQPGTPWFEEGAAWIAPGRPCLDINPVGVDELRRRGIEAHRLRLGYTARRDRWRGARWDRPTDLVYLGDETDRRVSALGGHAETLASHRCELRIFRSDHPVRPGRPGFLTAGDRTTLLAHSRVLVNIHRTETPYFEWVRLLDAMANGCAVVTEESIDVAPLEPGVHLLTASVDDVVSTAHELLDDEPRRAAIADAAWSLLRSELRAERLLADALAAVDGNTPPRTPGAPALDQPDPGSDAVDTLPATTVAASDWLDAVRSRMDDGDEPAVDVLADPATATVPDVSVVVLARDDDDTIGGTIDAAAAAAGGSGEVLVIDAGSSDGTRSRIQHAAKASGSSPIRAFAVGARSLDDVLPVVRRARGEATLIVDGRTCVTPDAVRRLRDTAIAAGTRWATGIGHVDSRLHHPVAEPPTGSDDVSWPALLVRRDGGDDRVAFLHDVVAGYRPRRSVHPRSAAHARDPDSMADDSHRYHRAQDLQSANDTVAFAAAAVRPGSRVLDVGAADGSVAAVLAAAGCEVVGVEPDPSAAARAREVCTRVIESAIDDLGPDDLGGPYDAVLVLDVLEHLHDPVAALQMLRAVLAEHGRLVVSVPNATHADIRLALLDNRFDYQDLGLLDRTHLRFFDHDGFRSLLAGGGFVVVDEGAVWRELGQTELGGGEVLARHPELVAHLHADPDATAYQFLAIAVPEGSPLADFSVEPAVRLRSHAAALEREVQHLRAQLAATSSDDGA